MISKLHLNQVYLGKMTLSFTTRLEGDTYTIQNFHELCNVHFSPYEVDLLLKHVRMSNIHHCLFIFDCPQCIQLITNKFPEYFL